VGEFVETEQLLYFYHLYRENGPGKDNPWSVLWCYFINDIRGIGNFSGFYVMISWCLNALPWFN